MQQSHYAMIMMAPIYAGWRRLDWLKKCGEPSSQYLFAVSRIQLAIDILTPNVFELDCKSPQCKRQEPFQLPVVFERQFATWSSPQFSDRLIEAVMPPFSKPFV